MSEEQTENREAEEDVEFTEFVRVSAQRRVCSDSRQQVLGLRQRGAGEAAVAIRPCRAWAQRLCS